MKSTDDLRYPCRDETFYGRGVWPLGEEGEMGALSEGHDRRAWAALNAWARDDQLRNGSDAAIALHAELGGPGTVGRPKLRWAVFVDGCGCSKDDHAEHQRRIDADDEDDACEEPMTCCSDITDNTDCDGLGPCGDTFAWMAKWHDDESTKPADAAPVLEWTWTL